MMAEMKKILIGIIVLFSLIIAGLVYLIVKPTTTNNNYYNIEKVENLIIPPEATTYDKPFATEKTNVKVYQGYKVKEPTYSDMNYTTPVFKKLNVKINNWCVSEEYQKMLWEVCEKYNVNFIKCLAVMYKEGARNNPLCEHKNSNGTIDYGLMQINEINIDVVKTLKHSTDTEWLKQPKANIECACYLMARNNKYYDTENLFEELVMYNGGYGAVKKIRQGEEHTSSKYAVSVMAIMEQLYQEYLYQEV